MHLDRLHHRKRPNPSASEFGLQQRTFNNAIDVDVQVSAAPHEFTVPYGGFIYDGDLRCRGVCAEHLLAFHHSVAVFDMRLTKLRQTTPSFTDALRRIPVRTKIHREVGRRDTDHVRMQRPIITDPINLAVHQASVGHRCCPPRRIRLNHHAESNPRARISINHP